MNRKIVIIYIFTLRYFHITITLVIYIFSIVSQVYSKAISAYCYSPKNNAQKLLFFFQFSYIEMN